MNVVQNYNGISKFKHVKPDVLGFTRKDFSSFIYFKQILQIKSVLLYKIDIKRSTQII